MILNVSSKCDIPAFFSEWFMNRLSEGYVDIRNQKHKGQIDRIILNKDNIDLIIFHTKNPMPILKYLDELKKYKILFYVSITPYSKLIEPNVESKRKILNSIISLSRTIGKQKLIVRYDPIILNDIYTIEFHKKAFTAICKILKGYVKTIIISFISINEININNLNKLNLKEITVEDMNEIISSFREIAKNNNIVIKNCFCQNQEEFPCSNCLDEGLVKYLVGKSNILSYKKSKMNPGHKYIKTIDIGFNNSCNHLCKYCSHNYDKKRVAKRIKFHNKNSSILLGKVRNDDIIKTI